MTQLTVAGKRVGWRSFKGISAVSFKYADLEVVAWT